jgi:T5orf172 domain
LLQPNFQVDKPGWIYVYCREEDTTFAQTDIKNCVLLHKIGRTSQSPLLRVKAQQSRNKEGNYCIKYSFHTQFMIFFEFLLHIYFHDSRIVRSNIKDGKTEWFLVSIAEVEDVVHSVQSFCRNKFAL